VSANLALEQLIPGEDFGILHRLGFPGRGVGVRLSRVIRTRNMGQIVTFH
jgi:hypothetical protein